jgi:pentatricopeptide repeat protein
MRGEGHVPDAFTFSRVLKVCDNGLQGEEIHAEVIKLGLFPKDTLLCNALVHMYARNGMLEKAQEVFDKLPAPDVVTWTVSIGGYVQQGRNEEALNCFGMMEDEGIPPDVTTFSRTLQACASMGLVDKGESIASEIRKQSLLGKDNVLGLALVDMYSKCGMLNKAEEVFNQLHKRDVKIGLYSRQGMQSLVRQKRYLFCLAK